MVVVVGGEKELIHFDLRMSLYLCFIGGIVESRGAFLCLCKNLSLIRAIFLAKAMVNGLVTANRSFSQIFPPFTKGGIVCVLSSSSF